MKQPCSNAKIVISPKLTSQGVVWLPNEMIAIFLEMHRRGLKVEKSHFPNLASGLAIVRSLEFL